MKIFLMILVVFATAILLTDGIESKLNEISINLEKIGYNLEKINESINNKI